MNQIQEIRVRRMVNQNMTDQFIKKYEELFGDEVELLLSAALTPEKVANINKFTQEFLSLYDVFGYGNVVKKGMDMGMDIDEDYLSQICFYSRHLYVFCCKRKTISQ